MPTCFNDKICFVHIPKCGGTSIARWMLDSPLNVRTTHEYGIMGHVPVWAIEETTKRPVDSYKMIIATIRNPYEQQFSQWKFWRERGERYKHTRMRIHDCDALAMSTTFEQFVQRDASSGRYLGGNHGDLFASNSPIQSGGVYRWWLSENNRVPKNLVVVKLEEAADQLPALLGRFADMPDTLPLINKTHRNVAIDDHLTDRAREVIEKKFAWAFTTQYEKLAVNC